jgi:hypothetical protein
MLKVYEAELVIDAEEVRALLEARGIEAFVFGEHTYNSPGVNPLAWPAVWVQNDDDYDTAKALVNEFERNLRHPPPSGRPWRCRHCGETNEPTFALCWNCGAHGPDT